MSRADDIFFFVTQVSNEKTPGYLGHIGDEILPSCVGITEDHYKDPCQKTSIMESIGVLFSWLRCLVTGVIVSYFWGIKQSANIWQF